MVSRPPLSMVQLSYMNDVIIIFILFKNQYDYLCLLLWNYFYMIEMNYSIINLRIIWQILY